MMKLLSVVLWCLLLVRADDDLEETVISDEEVKDVEDILYVTPKPTGHVYLAEHFDDAAKFRQKWVLSSAKKDGAEDTIAKYDGEWGVEPAERESLLGDLGLLLKSKAKHAAISKKLEQPFHFVSKPLVVQYDVTFQHGQDCGGAYLKLLTHSDTLSLHQFKDNTPYTIMFGPDKCGNDHKLHFIFRHKNPITGEITEKHAKRPSQKLEEVFKDKKPHLFTLIIKPDNTFEIQLDHKVVNSGNFLEDFNPPVNPPAEIDDPEDSKPQDWDEREKIPDPDAVKPEDWDEDEPAKISDPTATKPEGWLDDEPEMIYDPNAEKPDDWSDEMDGDWEAPLIFNPACEKAPGCGEWQPPQIDNPKYKGKWHRPMIANPNYKGVWKPRRIDNPNYYRDVNPFKMAPIGAVGLELWSMSDGLLFDNILLTDDKFVAENWARDTFDLKLQKIDRDSEGFLSKWAKYTNKHPWLWAVYVLVVGLPVILFISFCCGSSGKEEEIKKTDAISPDVKKSKSDLETKEVEQNDESQNEDSQNEDSQNEDSQNDSQNEYSQNEDSQNEEGSTTRRRQIRKDN